MTSNDDEFIERVTARMRQMDQAAADFTQALGLPDEAQYEIFTMLYADGPAVLPHSSAFAQTSHEERSHPDAQNYEHDRLVVGESHKGTIVENDAQEVCLEIEDGVWVCLEKLITPGATNGKERSKSLKRGKVLSFTVVGHRHDKRVVQLSNHQEWLARLVEPNRT